LFIRSFALAIRLFANLLAGHLVLFSIMGVIVVFGPKAAPLELMAVLIYMIEVLVAFLQAYIFTLLSAIFIGQRLHPAH
jgi:F-type H+-transporting ATPase subunit a